MGTDDGRTVDGGRWTVGGLRPTDAMAQTSSTVHRPSSVVGSVLRLSSFVVLALLVLWTGYSAATQRRYETANGFGGQILAGGSLGQTFMARYDGLSSVEVRIGTYGRQADPTRATLVMHLRDSPDTQDDIATVTLPPDTVLVENGWYRFSFPAIQASRNHTYYAQIESPDGTTDNGLTLFWYKPSPVGNAYAEGKAYRNGKPTIGADLSFGLGYAASPLQVWWEMLGAASVNSSPIIIGALLLAAFVGIVWALVWLPPIVRDPERRKRWLLRWSLPVVLAASLTNGLLFMLLVPPWQGPDEFSHYAYVALLDRYNLDDSAVESLDLFDKDTDTTLLAAINASADRQDFTRRIGATTNPGAPTVNGAGIFQQMRQPATYYWLAALATRIARALGARADPYSNPEAALMAMRSVSLILSLVVVALAWLAGALLSRQADSWLRLILPMTVAFLPMHTFIATVLNNDILAEVAVSALFVSLVALLRWPYGLRGLALAALSIVLTLATIPTKSTAVAAGLPLLAGGLLVWLGALIARRPTKRVHQSKIGVPSGPPKSKIEKSAILLLALLLLIAALLLAFERKDNQAKGWFTGYFPIERAARVQSSTAHDGSYVIELDPNGTNNAVATQNLLPPLLHPALNVVFSGWARVADAQLLAPKSVTVRLSVVEGDTQAGLDEVLLDPSDGWVRLAATGQVTAGAERVQLKLGSVGAPARVQFDDLSLYIEGVDGPWRDPIYTPVLLDPSGEESPTALRDTISKIVPGEIRSMADALVNGQAFSKVALWRDYASAQYSSYWSGFGWLTIYLPPLFYLLFSLLIIAALGGLVVRVVRRRRASRWAWLGFVSLIALATAILTGFAKQMSLLAYSALPATPQGRYLFVLTVPLAWLLLRGLGEIWRLVYSRITNNAASPNTPQSAIRNPQLAWIAALIFLAAYSLLGLIVPFYYS